MTDRYLAIPAPPETELSLEAAPRGQPHSVSWIDQDGEVIDEPLPVEVPEPVFAETFGPAAGPEWEATRADILLPATPPDGAVAVRLEGPGWAGRTLPLEAVTEAVPAAPDAPVLERGASNARWRLAVVGDGYSDAVHFEEDVNRLWNVMSNARPFKLLADEGLIGLVGLFWQAKEKVSLFGARQRDDNSWIIYGNNSAVVDAVSKTHARHDKILVVMNRPERGGAGGFKSSRPSWTSNVDTKPEEWPQIALHELGHAFGLADEYDTEGNGAPEPSPIEPNVSRRANPAAVEWHLSVSDAAFGKTPTLAWGADNKWPAHTVGTFEGSRYNKENYYRPSYGCRMRWTTYEFCDVCAQTIEDVVRGS